MKPPVLVPRRIDLDAEKGLVIDGVHIPWAIGPHVDVDDQSGGRGIMWGLTVTFYADRLVLDTPTQHLDTVRETARAEALRIVREGLREHLIWLGEEVDP